MNNDVCKTILLVEDDEILSMADKMWLEEYGYNAIIANTGEEAVNLFKENNGINLILMDIDLGKSIDGIETAKMILNERDIPIVFLTSHTEPEIVEKTEKITSYGYVVKNSGITVLDASIKMAFKLFEANEKLKHELSERKNAEAVARDIFERKNALLMANPDMMFVFDKNGVLLDYHSGDDSQLIVTPKLFIGKNISEVMTPEIADLTKKKLINIFETGQKQVYEYQLEINSEIRHFESRVVLCGDSKALGIVRDITEHKLSEEVKRKSEERYRILVESQLELVCIWLPDTTLTYVNEAYCRLMGKSRRELIGLKWIDFIPESSRFEVLENYRKAVEAKQVYSYVHEVEGENGILWYRWNDVPLFNEEGNLLEFQSVGHDITERKAAEDKIKALLAEKEIILQEVHHRIKNNMSNIKAILLLQADSLNDSSAVAALHDAAGRVQSMSGLYDKLYKSFNFKEISTVYYLSSLIDEIILSFPACNPVKIVKKIDDFVLEIIKIQPLGIIINELLSNIMKYAFNGIDDGVITVTANLKGNKVVIEIADNGIGIPESITFENSTGFGMKLVRMLTKQINGSIRIERGAGTRFVLEFEV